MQDVEPKGEWTMKGRIRTIIFWERPKDRRLDYPKVRQEFLELFGCLPKYLYHGGTDTLLIGPVPPDKAKDANTRA